MGWFSELTGFSETSYDATRNRLRIEGGRLFSDASSHSYGVGNLQLLSLETLRSQRLTTGSDRGLSLDLVSADVADLHRDPANAAALFQVASQFNLLEMTGPEVTPEDGVSRYAWDNTQGPACAIAAGAATIYRNYFAPVGGHVGQTADRQLDGLSDIGDDLAELTRLPVHQLWAMRNGYALATPAGLTAIGHALSSMAPNDIDRLRGRLKVGFHAGVEITDAPAVPGQLVSQVFCSALPHGYSGLAASAWEPFARLILEAAYEATLDCALLNARQTGSSRVYLTLLGAGAFGNPRGWVFDAIRRALGIFREASLHAGIVSQGAAPDDLKKFAASVAAGFH